MGPIESQSSQSSSKNNTSASPVQPTVILEPTTITVPEQVPWYKRLMGGSGTRTQNVWRLSFVVMFLLGILVVLQGKKPPTLITKAGNYHARITLIPDQVTISQNAFVQLWATSDATVTSGRFTISFDTNKISLTDLTISNGSIPSLSEANTTGIISVTIPKTKDSTPPVGTFQIMNMKFNRKLGATGSATISLIPRETNIFHNTVPFVITGMTGSTLILNSVE